MYKKIINIILDKEETKTLDNGDIFSVFESEFAELCFDINYYNDKIDYEIEYEYKANHDGFTLFNSILSSIDLPYTKNCKSKIQRALGR